MLANVIVILIIAALVAGACAKIIIDKRNWYAMSRMFLQ